MATVGDAMKSALLVVDVQRGVVSDAYDRDQVVARIGKLVSSARAENVPVIWVRHSDEGLLAGSDEWQIVEELQPTASEVIVEKNYGDSFEATDLADVLATHNVGRLVVTGAQSDACIRSTLHGAFVRGYDTLLVSDAHTTQDQSDWGAPAPETIVSFTNLYWTFHSAPGRTAGTVAAADVSF